MKKFHFPLNRVLEWKTVVAQQEQTALQALEQRHIEIQASLIAMDENIRALSESPEESVDGHDLVYSARAREALQRRRSQTEQDRSSCEQQIVAQQRKFRTAETERKLVDKLRDRSHASWSAEVSRTSEEQVSELFLGSWNRR